MTKTTVGDTVVGVNEVSGPDPRRWKLGSGAVSITRRYLEAVAGHDWPVAADCVATGVRRVGPFGDVFEGRDAYIAFLRDLMPTLAGYSMTIHRVLECEGGSTVMVELDEKVEMDGKVIDTPECLVFDLDDDGLIAGITIYIQRH